MRCAGLASALALTSLLGSHAAAQELRPVLTQRVVGLVEPMGAEHAIQLGARAPVGDPRELLFADTHVELGVSSYTTPIDSMNGAYLQVSPLAFLVLRAELLGVTVWPLGIDGAGYYGVSGDLGELGPLPAGDARHASGWVGLASAVLQLAFPIGPLRVIVWNQLGVEHVRVGDADYQLSARHDAVLARGEWIVDEDAMVLLEGRLGDQLLLRGGAYDALRFVPRSGYLANQAGLIAALSIERVDPAVPEVMPFARVGVYTDGRRAGSFTLLAGITVRYELAPP